MILYKNTQWKEPHCTTKGRQQQQHQSKRKNKLNSKIYIKYKNDRCDIFFVHF